MKEFTSKNLTASRIIVNKQKDSDVTFIGEEKQLKTQFTKVNDNEWNGSVLQVLFKNEAFARKYRSKVERFLKDLLEEGEEFIVYHPPHSNSEQEFKDTQQTFHIDRVKGDSHGNENPPKNIPAYSSQYEDTLECNGTENEEPEKPKEDKPSLFTCFNCLGDHHMKECPEKLDYSNINMNKKNILVGNSIRYHTDENNTFTPGKFSKELRQALGLKDNQLPQFIYHMRVIGYPPGWMDEAVFEKSGLSLYDLDGKASTGDISPPPCVKGTLYDGNKFLEFPGFNTPVPEGCMDQWKILNMPPLQEHQQLQQALQSPNIIFNSNAFKRKQSALGNEDSKKIKTEAKSCIPPSNETPKKESARNMQPQNLGYVTPDTKKENKRHSMSISVSPGTPILEQGNPFQRLPNADKFAEGITEHLPFENLPDSVGSYEKMRGVISDVQKKLNDIKS